MKTQLEEAIRSVTADIVATAPESAAASTQSRSSRRNETSLRWVAAAAAMLVVVGIGGLLLIGDGTDEAPASTRPLQAAPLTTVPASDPAGATAVVTYDLSLAGAELTTDDSFTVGNADGAIWMDSRTNVYLSLMVREGLGAQQSTPSGLGPMTELADLPEWLGRAWITDIDPAVETEGFERRLWWTRGDDVWFVTVFASPPSQAMGDPVGQQLSNWATEITSSGEGAKRSYALDAPGMELIATDHAGEFRTRTRVWTLDGHEITLLATENAEASGRRNLLSVGPAMDIEVAGVSGLTAGPTDTGGTKVGWPIDSSTATWADLTIPASLVDRTDEIIAAIRPIPE